MAPSVPRGRLALAALYPARPDVGADDFSAGQHGTDFCEVGLGVEVGEASQFRVVEAGFVFAEEPDAGGGVGLVDELQRGELAGREVGAHRLAD